MEACLLGRTRLLMIPCVVWRSLMTPYTCSLDTYGDEKSSWVCADGTSCGLKLALDNAWESDTFMVKIASAKSHRATWSTVKSWKGVADRPGSIMATANGTIPIALKKLTEKHALGAKPPNTRVAQAKQCLETNVRKKTSEEAELNFCCFNKFP